MDFYIEIIKKGKVQKRKLEIDRVPYLVYKLAQKTERKALEVQKMGDEITVKESDIIDIKKEKPEGWRDVVKELKGEIKECENFILGIDDAGFFDDRFEAIKVLLEANGISEADELMNLDTWERYIDYSSPMSLITLAINKDRKKVQAAT